jgi:hypothetical protein
MSEVPLNKFEKRDLVIRLLKKRKTYLEICHLAHVSPWDIKPILKKYEQQKRLENTKRKGNNQEPTTRQLSISSQAFVLYQQGKKIDVVKVFLDIPFKLAIRYWKQYLKSKDMFEAYEFYQEYSYDIPTLLSIVTFMKRNNVYGPDIVNVIRTINDVNNLKQTYSNVKNEVEKLRQIKNNLQYTHNNYLPPLKPLPNPSNWIINNNY